MRIAIPVDDNTMNTSICISFGRTPYFLIYDTETQNAVFLDNSAVALQGGAGIKASQTIVDNKADVLLTPRCGENAAEVLRAANVKIYETDGNKLMQNIEFFGNGKLKPLSEIGPGFHGGK